MSVLIKGPAATPYEDGLFAFDVHLPADFPSVPPVFHYLSFCSERLNPNLYEDGKVCVSLLGTWTGKVSHLVNFLTDIVTAACVEGPRFKPQK